MPSSEITSLTDGVQTEPPRISTISPGEPIPLTSLLENHPTTEQDPRATIWQSMSSIPPEISEQIYETIKNLPPDIYEVVGAEMIRAYRHNILSNTQDTVPNGGESTLRLSKEDETKLLRGSTFNIFTNRFLVDYLGKKNGSTKH